MNTLSRSPHHSLKKHPLLQYKDLILKCIESEDGHTIPGDTAFQDFKAECESLFHKTWFSHTYFQMQVRLGSTQLANAYSSKKVFIFKNGPLCFPRCQSCLTQPQGNGTHVMNLTLDKIIKFIML